MKLKNKKTGEIVNAKEVDLHTTIIYLKISKDGRYDVIEYDSLAELNEEWEDYEEPETFWYVTAWGDVKEYSQDQFAIKQKQAIGNYFETKEEAEKAVKKLKAVKRLREANIDYKLSSEYDDFTETMHANVSFSFNSYPLVGKDLDLLFFQEED